MKKLQGKLLFDPPDFLEPPHKFSKKSDFDFIRKLGDGSYSQVWRVKHKRLNKFFAIKQVQKCKVNFIIYQFFREVEILYKLSHPHIIKLYSHFEDDNSFYLIMELMEGGTLFHKLYREKSLSESSAGQIFREIIMAVEYMHSQEPPIMHRDIKPENIMLDKDQRVKLIDFGWSNYIESTENRKTYCGTAEYMSPEMILKNGHGLGIDIWCLGILLFEMLAGYTPFKSNDKSILYRQIIEGSFKLPEKISPSAQKIILSMLEKDLQVRANIFQVRNCEWLKEVPPIRKTIHEEESERSLAKTRIIYGAEFNTEATNSSESDPDIQLYWGKSTNKLREKLAAVGKENGDLKRKIAEIDRKALEEDGRMMELEGIIFQKKREMLRISNSSKDLLSRIFDCNLELEMVHGNDITELFEKKNEVQNKLTELSKKCKFKKTLLENLRKEVNKCSINYSNYEKQLQKMQGAYRQLQCLSSQEYSGRTSSENELKVQINALKYQLGDFNIGKTSFSSSELPVAKEISLLIKTKMKTSDQIVVAVEERLEKLEEKLNDTEQSICELNFSYHLRKCLMLNKFQVERIKILKEKNSNRKKNIDRDEDKDLQETGKNEIKKEDAHENQEIRYARNRITV